MRLSTWRCLSRLFFLGLDAGGAAGAGLDFFVLAMVGEGLGQCVAVIGRWSASF